MTRVRISAYFTPIQPKCTRYIIETIVSDLGAKGMSVARVIIVGCGPVGLGEVWDSVEHLMPHVKTPHYLAWAELSFELNLSGRKVTLFHISAEQEV